MVPVDVSELRGLRRNRLPLDDHVSCPVILTRAILSSLVSALLERLGVPLLGVEQLVEVEGFQDLAGLDLLSFVLHCWLLCLVLLLWAQSVANVAGLHVVVPPPKHQVSLLVILQLFVA